MPRAERSPARHALAVGLFAAGLVAVGALAGLTVAALVSGARGAAGVFALLTLAASPLLAAGWARGWWRFGRGR